MDYSIAPVLQLYPILFRGHHQPNPPGEPQSASSDPSWLYWYGQLSTCLPQPWPVTLLHSYRFIVLMLLPFYIESNHNTTRLSRWLGSNLSHSTMKILAIWGLHCVIIRTFQLRFVAISYGNNSTKWGKQGRVPKFVEIVSGCFYRQIAAPVKKKK